MKTFGYKAWLAAGLLGSSGTAWACADSSCYPSWKLFGGDYACEGRGFLNPGNDTRINLLFLVRDRAGPAAAPKSYPNGSYDTSGFGEVFFDPYMQLAAYFGGANATDGKSTGESASYSGTRCAGFVAATGALSVVMEANTALPATERGALLASRAASEQTCKDGDGGSARAGLTQWPAVSSQAGREFLGYIRAADAFYAGQWDQARGELGALTAASDPWVRETAAYLTIRVEYAAAQALAFGEYGDFDPAKVDRAAVKRGLLADAAYLKTWPSGRYAASALGLVRRGLWLAGDFALLGREYERVLGSVDPGSAAAGDLVFEVDNKWLFNTAASDAQAQGPMLLAVQDLKRMRVWQDLDGKTNPPDLTEAKLAAQAPLFAAQPDLYAFVQASYAYYIAKDPRRVLTLIPDDARKPAHTNLAFSRQILRGQALAALKDRNEEGFWLELLGGAKGWWQRPTVELGLAMNWERNGKLAQVFAKGSPITETMIRRQLILNAAAPGMLRADAADPSRPHYERDLAVFTLLHKDLSRGDFAAFVRDQALVPAGASTDGGLYYLPDQESVPVGLFTRGRWSDGYACPALVQTAKALAANPGAIGPRLCLGDFWRINGFDQLNSGDMPRKSDELGGVADLFPGKPLARSAIYAGIIADPRVAGPDKAYALYRAVMCYAPSGNNSCGGRDVPKEQRKAWYDQLKRDYPASLWARKLRYFW